MVLFDQPKIPHRQLPVEKVQVKRKIFERSNLKLDHIGCQPYGFERFTWKLVRADIDELNRITFEQERYKFEKRSARIRKMQEGLEKIRKAGQRKPQELAKDAAEEKAKKEADQKAKDDAIRKPLKSQKKGDREAREEQKNKPENTDDPDDPNAAQWKHKPYCRPDTPPTQRLRCLGIYSTALHGQDHYSQQCKAGILSKDIVVTYRFLSVR